MSELRRGLLDTDTGSPELSPELSFLAARQSALAALLIDHAALYRRLWERMGEEGGVTEELAAVALEAAGDLATLMQTLRRREDLLSVLAAARPVYPTFPAAFIDQLIFSFTLLAQTDDAESHDIAWRPSELDLIMGHEVTQKWLADVGVRDVDMRALSARYRAEEL